MAKIIDLPFEVTGQTVTPTQIENNTLFSVADLRKKFIEGCSGKMLLVEGATVLRLMGIPQDGTFVRRVRLLPSHKQVVLKDLERNQSFVASLMSQTYSVRDPDMRDLIRHRCFEAVRTGKMNKVAAEIEPHYPVIAKTLLSKEAQDAHDALMGRGGSSVAKFDVAYLQKFFASHTNK